MSEGLSAAALGIPRALYPFTAHHFEQPGGHLQHYLDEGQGAPVVMVHGNPSWSFLFRHLVFELRGERRCIVPDHIGMGLSDKPDDTQYRYTLSSRIDDLERLLAHAVPDGPVDLVVHDWGGAIGFGWAARHPQRIRRLVILNTGAFRKPADKALPWQLKLVRDTPLGALLVRGLNAFAVGTTWIGTVRPMPRELKRAFTAPYRSAAGRRSTLRFVQDIPLAPGDPAWDALMAVEAGLPALADRPTLIGWGERDFVFDEPFLAEFIRRFPQAEVHRYADAAHYVLEDAHEDLAPKVREFLAR